MTRYLGGPANTPSHSLAGLLREGNALHDSQHFSTVEGLWQELLGDAPEWLDTVMCVTACSILCLACCGEDTSSPVADTLLSAAGLARPG